MLDNLNNNKKNTGTKLMFGVLVFFGIATLILGVLQITRKINIGGAESVDNSQDLLSNADQLEPSIDELKSTDTDGDGLSDFDELYIYSTSPYLADSDSDGFSDKQEIDGGYDPNCPKGQDCRSQATDNSQQGIGGGVEEQTGLEGSATATSSSRQTTDSLQPAANSYTPEQIAEIRQALLAAGGISKEQLDAIPDEELIKTLEETLKEQQQ